MNDSNALPAFLTGVLLTMVFFVLLDLLPESYRSLAVAALEECEKCYRALKEQV